MLAYAICMSVVSVSMTLSLSSDPVCNNETCIELYRF